MEIVKIQSDTRGKINKMIEGTVFDSPLAFITELFQNAQRAKAKKLDISMSASRDSLTFLDDGKGLDNPEDLLMLDYSKWSSTNEGFGIGFWSVLAIPEIESICIRSKNTQIYINVEDVKESLEASLSTISKMKGFSVEVKSPYFKDNYQEIVRAVVEQAQTMPFVTYFEDIPIKRIDIFKLVDGEFTMEFNNRLFKAKLALKGLDYSYPIAYYEHRKVVELYEFSHISGIVEFKAKAVNLKEPDRKTIVSNEKSRAVKDKIKECVKIMLKAFIEEIQEDDNMINKYAEVFSRYLEPKDYERYLTVSEDLLIEPEKKAKRPSRPVSNKASKTDSSNFEDDIEPDYTEECLLMGDIGQNEDELLEDSDNVDQNKSSTDEGIQKERTMETVTVAASIKSNPVKKQTAKKSDRQFTLKKLLAKKTPVMWVDACESEKFENDVQSAKYYGIKVIVAANDMYKKVLTENYVPHISEIEKCILKEYVFENMGYSTAKEEYFISTLNPIIKKYALEDDTFKVANISLYIQFSDLRGREYSRKKLGVQAVKSGDNIIFNRPDLHLYLFPIDAQIDHIGKNELKAIMYHLDTISHEMAHLIYGTVDKTVNHFEIQSMIQGEIVKAYI